MLQNNIADYHLSFKDFDKAKSNFIKGLKYVSLAMFASKAIAINNVQKFNK